MAFNKQTIPEPDLPIKRVQQEFDGLSGTSSMVYPKLPEGMSQDARVTMKLNDPLDGSKTVKAMKRTEPDGWLSGTFERSSSGNFVVDVSPETEQ